MEVGKENGGEQEKATIFNRVVRESVTEKVTFKRRP